jgi:hypothetical protein
MIWYEVVDVKFEITSIVYEKKRFWQNWNNMKKQFWVKKWN